MILVQRFARHRVLSRNYQFHRAHEFSRAFTAQPNTPLNLDPSLQEILQEGEMTLKTSNTGKRLAELEILSPHDQLESTEVGDDEVGGSRQRKSPAADYGSRRIGAVILPNQLQNAINAIISESDRVQLRNDAKRLFFVADADSASDDAWESYYNPQHYRSRQQATRHAERDGIAFATIALPAHYSAIMSVFNHLKQRLEPEWRPRHVIDWGAGAGSGLWAALHAFHSPPASKDDASNIGSQAFHSPPVSQDDAYIMGKQVSDSYILSYLGVDKRDSLVALGKRLLNNVELGNLNVEWQKSFKHPNQLGRSAGHDAIALSAFMLTSLPDSRTRKALVNQMWESGAHVMVLIDHNTPEGFEAITQAREYLLNKDKSYEEPDASQAQHGRIQASHVVAPCPHDGACPLRQSGSPRFVCGFSQRIQRPSFIRKTKHSGVGHEDIEYSYVIIRKGPRPPVVNTNYGRVGEVGRRVLEKEALSQAPMKELKLHTEDESIIPDTTTEVHPSIIPENLIAETENEPASRAELEEALRLESYTWPRLVFPPLKKSGHIILDSCTAEGKIMRITIPRSQGKQAYYDARKSSWGDIFPHPPKNPPQERFGPKTKHKTKSDL